jgi:hypothetical protein
MRQGGKAPMHPKPLTMDEQGYSQAKAVQSRGLSGVIV